MISFDHFQTWSNCFGQMDTSILFSLHCCCSWFLRIWTPKHFLLKEKGAQFLWGNNALKIEHFKCRVQTVTGARQMAPTSFILSLHALALAHFFPARFTERHDTFGCMFWCGQERASNYPINQRGLALPMHTIHEFWNHDWMAWLRRFILIITIIFIQIY